MIALDTAYPKESGQKTRFEYYVDVALKDAGYQVKTTTNPGAVRVIWQEQVRLLTGNGPESVDAQATKLREILHAARQRTPSAPATRSLITGTPRRARIAPEQLRGGSEV